MTREQKSGKKHISMELTADSARVTNLSLEGSRLVLVIEAELEGSHLRSSDDPSTQKQPDSTQPDRGPDSASAPSLGSAQPENAEPSILNMGSENLPPATAAFTPDRIGIGDPAMGTISTPLPQSLAVTPEDILSATDGFQPPASVLDDNTSSVIDATDSTSTPYKETEPAPTGPTTPPPLPVVDSAPKRWNAPELVSEDSSKDIITHPPSPEKETASPIQEPLMDEQLTLSEESSTIGGVRHGEPQPAISFGQDMPEPAKTTPSSGITPAPQAVVPPPIPHQPQQTPAPETSAPKTEEQTGAGKSEEQHPAPEAEKPSDAGDKASSPDPQTKSTEQESAKSEPDGGQPPEKPAGGGTTVLIRYTCPKCKTQGMQAVDKVGTVVNCSNCGKAMRLVMKK